MSEDLRLRTLGEVVGGLRDNKQLGRICVAIFPGISKRLYAPIFEADALAAGVELTPGSLFTAEVDVNALRTEELKPANLDILLPKGTILKNN